MKKTLCVVLALTILASLLSGCCIKHDWEKATCTAPMTCKECGKTKEEALGHLETVWEVSYDRKNDTLLGMETLCARCLETVIEPLDLEMIAKQDLVGKWSVAHDASSKEGTFTLLDFYEDGTFDYIINGDRNTGTWAYDRSNTEKYIYSFTPGTIAILMEMSLTGDPKLQEWIDTAVEFYPTPDSSPFYACYYALSFFKLTM